MEKLVEHKNERDQYVEIISDLTLDEINEEIDELRLKKRGPKVVSFSVNEQWKLDLLLAKKDEIEDTIQYRVYSKSGVLESNEKINKRQIRDGQKRKIKKRFMDDKKRGLLNVWEEVENEQKQFLDMINFDTLNAILSELVHRSAGRKTTTNELGRDSVVMSCYGDGENSVHNQLSNTIGVYLYLDEHWNEENAVRKQEKLEWEKIFEKIGSKELSAFVTVAHEFSHAAGKNICIRGSNNRYDLAYAQTGYKRGLCSSQIKTGLPNTKDGRPVDGNFFIAFNEGVTEKIGYQVALEYFKREGWPQQEVGTAKIFLKELSDKKYSNKDDLNFSYAEEVRLINELISLISQDTNVPSDTVWQSIMEGYFRGRNLFESELVKQWFVERLGDDFVDILTKADIGFWSSKHNKKMFDYINEAKKRSEDDAMT